MRAAAGALVLLACTGADPAATVDPPLIALTPTEYDNTVADLLGLPRDGDAWPAAPAVHARLTAARGETVGLFGFQPAVPPPWPWPHPPEVGVDGFDGLADGQEPSAYRTEVLQDAAVHFGAYTLVSPEFFVCDGWAGLVARAQKECGWNSLVRFAQRAWRRPLTTEEALRLSAFYTASWAAGAPDAAIALTAAGILQAPQFVFRIEAGTGAGDAGRVPLTDWEMASRLSYFLWDTMPDPALFAAAAEGRLSTRAQIADQTRRMLDDARARDAVVRFHIQWLETDRVHRIAPARSAHGPRFGLTPEPPLDTTGDGDWPAVLGPLRHAFDAELQLLIGETVLDGAGTLAALLTTTDGWVADASMPIYGSVEARAGEPVTWDFGNVTNSLGAKDTLTLSPARFPASERAGVLTHPAVLAVGAHPVHPSPILRGKRVLERLACVDLAPPPAGAEGAAPPDTADAADTNRGRTAAATAAEACAVCHDALNPPGFAFEHYDALGAFRSTDNGVPVDAAGTATIGDETYTFVDGVDLAHQLAASPTVHDCYALRWARVATGLALDADDPGVAALQAGFRADGDVRGLLEAITTSDLFRTVPRGGR